MCVYTHQVSGSGINLQASVSVVQQMMQRLSKTQQEVNELQTQEQIQIQDLQENMRFCRKHREKLMKVLTTGNQMSFVWKILNCDAAKFFTNLYSTCTMFHYWTVFRPSRTWSLFLSCWTHVLWWIWVQICRPPGCRNTSSRPNHILLWVLWLCLDFRTIAVFGL